jgi:spermidine synthase
VLGDGRLSLEKEPPQHFDLLALDTFTGDAIPSHMLTREAFTVYERHMNTNGIIAVHISNGYLDLEPVLANIARELNYQIVIVEHPPPGPARWWVSGSHWALLTRNKDFLKTPSIAAVARPPHEKNIRLWTDDFTSLFQVLRQVTSGPGIGLSPTL